MNKSDARLGSGLVAAMAICCGAKLLIFVLPMLALATGQVVLIAAAVVAALAVAGVVVWRRRSHGCAGRSCTPRSTPVRS